jgi:hypothetical protein
MTPRKTEKYHRYKIPNVVTVQVDTREKFPILFPDMVRIADPELLCGGLPVGVGVEKVALPFGDYRLAEFPDCAVIERKASRMEITKNMMDPNDSARQAKAFRKLAAGCRYPYLLVEASPSHLLSPGQGTKNPEAAMSRLSIAMAKYNLRMLFIPWRSRDAKARRLMGTLMIHVMLGCALSKTYDVPTLELL